MAERFDIPNERHFVRRTVKAADLRPGDFLVGSRRLVLRATRLHTRRVGVVSYCPQRGEMLGDWRVDTTMTIMRPRVPDTETRCHCLARYGGSDHCPVCGCEQYESGGCGHRHTCSAECGEWGGCVE